MRFLLWGCLPALCAGVPGLVGTRPPSCLPVVIVKAFRVTARAAALVMATKEL
ncbi:hypothetical protein [Actinomyces naeslundii]|uniref:hypothetical protein n=1 Tax=Actinomyces naeslundii TaxID=1655 RepID=UPI000A8C3A61|nr:hypothetical protein [Actinomyces naeslundii]